MRGQGLIKIVDLEKDSLAIDFYKRTKVVLGIRVIGVAEIVIDGDGR